MFQNNSVEQESRTERKKGCVRLELDYEDGEERKNSEDQNRIQDEWKNYEEQNSIRRTEKKGRIMKIRTGYVGQRRKEEL